MSEPFAEPTCGIDATGRRHRTVGLIEAGAPFEVVFLDRDGTLNALAPGYRTMDDIVLLPGAVKAAAALSCAGARLVLVTNQRGLAIGALSWEQLDAVNSFVLGAVAAAGGVIDDVRLCPHDVGRCSCRKPLPGLITTFFADNPVIRPDRCVMVGDADSDAAAARAAGVPFVRVPSDVGLVAALDSLCAPPAGRIRYRS